MAVDPTIQIATGMRPVGLFVGMTTLDLIYLAPQIPQPNQKLVALEATTAAGGPATNAAVAFQYLGNHSQILSAIGQHPSTAMIHADLAAWGVERRDLAPDRTESPPISSIIVTQSTGERAVISINATRFQAAVSAIPEHILANVQIVLIDGHQMQVGAAIAAQAKAIGIPVVIDGGSWKPGFETVLPYVDYAICSANFLPPACVGSGEVFDFLEDFAIPYAAITQGSQPILYHDRGRSGQIAVPAIRAVDTLGAGDFFHGAFCHYILQMPFESALAQAAQVAARSCQHFGTRTWMTHTQSIFNRHNG
jgi:sugar/nucleoside kinase (ribokinase family)